MEIQEKVRGVAHLLVKYQNLAVVKRNHGEVLKCLKCQEDVVLEQRTTEISDLIFKKGSIENDDLSFRAGKPEVTDGEEKIRCGCGTSYPITDWEPY